MLKIMVFNAKIYYVCTPHPDIRPKIKIGFQMESNEKNQTKFVEIIEFDKEVKHVLIFIKYEFKMVQMFRKNVHLLQTWCDNMSVTGFLIQSSSWNSVNNYICLKQKWGGGHPCLSIKNLNSPHFCSNWKEI